MVSKNDLNENQMLIPKNVKQQLLDDSQRDVKCMTYTEKIRFVITNITVEPVLACYIIPSIFSGLATQNLNLEKACRVNLNYGDEICDALTIRQTANYTFEEQSVQKLVATMTGYKSALGSVVSCCLILFWGSWSDRHNRRKPCILVPFIGELLAVTGLMLCTYFESWPLEYTIFIEGFFPAITGGSFTAMMGMFSYISHISSKEQRTVRIGILNLCLTLGVPIGMAFSGILLKQIGFYGVFSITVILFSIGFLYGIFFVNEINNCKDKQKIECGVLADFFDKKHVFDTFNVMFKKDENQRSKRILVLLFVLMVVTGPVFGEQAVIYLYTRFQFNWSAVDYSIFSTFNMLIHLIGTSFSLAVFSHLLKMDDTLIGVISSTSKFISGFVFAFAVTTWQFYLGPLVEFLNGTSFIAMRSIASKLVSSEDLGKMNSIFGFVEAFMPLIFAPMYTSIYASTITTLPGTFFLIGSGSAILAIFIFLWMYAAHRRECKRTFQEEKDLQNGEKPSIKK